MGIDFPRATNPEVDPACGPIAKDLGQRMLLKCVDWMRQQSEPVDERLWAEVYKISQHGRSARTRLNAARMFLDRLDPIPRPAAVEVQTGPISISWKSSSPTPLDPSSRPSTMPFTGNALAPRASSAIDVLENL